MPNYSFMNCNASLSGPGGTFTLGYGAGTAKEGIKITPAEDKNVMTIGADGSVQHSLRADASAQVEITLLKTSPVNSQLMSLYSTQSSSAAQWGLNTISISDNYNGDVVTLTQVAFQRVPDITYAEEGGTYTWKFQAGSSAFQLGVGAGSGAGTT